MDLQILSLLLFSAATDCRLPVLLASLSMLGASVYVFICFYVKSNGMLGKACFIDLS
jgi:hypothetical protein